MKKFLKLMLLAALFCVPWVTNAQTHYNVQVGSGTATSSYIPAYSYYSYSYTQMLYTAAEVGIDGEIDTIAFQVSSGSSTRTVTVYMAEVSQTTLGPQVAETEFHQVFSGSVSWASGWVYIPLDSVFNYQDTGSLVIAVIDGTGSWASVYPYYSGTTMLNNRTRYTYTDNSAYTLTSQMGDSTSFLPNIKIGISSNSTYCATPSDVVVTNINFDSAHISWVENGAATAWEVIVSDSVITDFTNATGIGVNENSYTVTGLSGNTPYYVYVRANCDVTSVSGWTNAAYFRSACMGYTAVPYVTGFEDAENGMPNCWHQVLTGTSGAGIFPSAYTYSTNARNGNVYYEFESNSGQTEVAALPMMENINTLQVEFYAACMNTNFMLEVGVIEDDTAFVPVDTVALIPGSNNQWHNSYRPYTVYFDQYSGNGDRIGMRVSGIGSYTLMIDDLSVIEIPSCMPPANFKVDSIGSDWVALGWNDEVASSWEVIYDTNAINPATTALTAVTVTDPYVVLTNLVNGRAYNAYVRSDCGDEYSPWVGPLTFIPGQYVMAYSGSDTIRTCGISIYDHGGANGAYDAYANFVLVVYPSSDDSLVSFSGSTDIYSYYAHLRIYDGVGISGNILWQSSNDNEIIPVINSNSGPITIQFTAGSYNYGYDGFEINTTCVAAPQCAVVQNLQTPTVGVSSAYVTWSVAGLNLGVPAYYEVNCYDANNVVVFTATPTDNNVMITGLSPLSQYKVTVRSVCDENNVGEMDSVLLSTASLACIAIDLTNSHFDTIGTGTTSFSYLPSYALYNYSLTQQIYTATEIGHGGLITALSMMPSAVASQRTYEIYLAHTSASSLSDFIYPSDLTLVYSGSETMTADQWTEWTLDNPFNYNGSDNLLVCFRDMTGSWVSGTSWYTHSTTDNMGCYVYRDGSAYNFTTTGGYASSSRNNIAISMMACAQTATCAAPIVVVDSVSTDYVGISWGAGYQETSWTVEHRIDSSNVWVVDGTTTTNTWAYSNLGTNELYHFRVGSICSDTTMYTEVSVRTKCGNEALPFIYGFEDFPSSGYPSCWYKATTYAYGDYPAPSTSTVHGGTQSLYMYSGTGSYSYVVLPELDASIDTLEINFWVNAPYDTDVELYVGVMTDAENFNTFQTVGVVSNSQVATWEAVRVRFNNYHGNGTRIAIVSPEDYYTEIYIDDISVNIISPCNSVENIRLLDATTDSATIAWNGGDNTNFEYVYGPAGFVLDSGTVESANLDTIILAGLTPNTQYDIYVRTLCGGGDTSNWSNAFSFRTDCLKITAIPYTEGFENNAPGWSSNYSQNFYPCWYRSNNPNTSYYYPYVDSYSAHNGSYGIEWSWDSWDGYEPYIVMPAIDTNVIRIDTLQLSFWAANGGYGDVPMIYIGTMTNPAAINTLQILDTVFITSDAWTLYEVSLQNYSGHGEYVAILSGNTGDYWYAAFDDFSLDYLPPCPHVRNLAVTGSTATSVTLGWTELGSATTWEVAYDTVATATPTASVTATSTTATIAGLTPSTYYYFWVRGICGGGDTAAWEGPVMAVPGTWNMRPNMTDTVYMCGGIIFDDGGPTGAYSSGQTSVVIIMPDSAGSLVSVSGQSYTEGSYDYLTIYDGAGTSGTVLWDDYDSYDQNTFGPFISSNGPITLEFTSDGSVTYDGFEVNVNCVSTYCRVIDLQLDATVPQMSSQLALTWTGSDANSFEIEWDTTGFVQGTGNLLTATTNSIVIAGLTGFSSYDVYVRSICGAGDTGAWTMATFQTAICDGMTVAENWDTTMTSGINSYYPIGYGYYDYSYVQTIVDSAFLTNLGGDITAFAFYPSNTTGGSLYSTVDVYLANVSESDLSAGWILPDSAHVFVKVLDNANLNFTEADWQIHAFDTAFTWDGHSNILVAVNDLHGDYASASSFHTHSASAAKTRYAYRDNTPFAYDNPGASGSAASYNTGDLRLISCGPACPKPSSIQVAAHDYQSATLTWSGNANDYEVAVKAATDATWPSETAVSTMSYAATGLQPATTYQFRVRAVCDAAENFISDWAEFTFVTDSLPCFAPTELQATATTYTTAVLGWTNGGEETQWSIHVWNSTFNQEFTATGNPFTVTGLTQTTTYYATVKSICGGGLLESEVSDTIQFTTATCVQVSGVTAAAVDGHSAIVSWNDAGVTSYQIEYGYTGFTTGQGHTITVENITSYTLTGLEPETGYDVYVRAMCETGVYGGWSAVASFTTPEVGISVADGMNVSIYPNPTSSSTTIALSGVSGEVAVSIVDMNGRVVMSDSMSCEGDCTKTMEVSGLAQGAYFVRISGEGVNMVKKLVVK